jgi:hypothetical protein
MAYFEGTTATNFGDTSPSGNFSPAIFSQKVLMFFRTASVVEGITNSDYFGEISGFGDTVRVIKEPKLTVSAYTRGLATVAQALVDDEITLEISKANYFQFNVDDIETKLSHINWQSLATGSATYALKNSYDKEVLEYMSIQCDLINIVNTDASIQGAGSIAAGHIQAQEITNVITLGFGGGSEVDPLNLLSLLALKLDERDIPEEGRWVVVSPRFMELIAKTDSKLLSTDYNQGEGGLKNGLVMNGKLRGFAIHKTNNNPKFYSDTDGTAVTGTVGADFDADGIVDQTTTVDSDSDDTIIASGDNAGVLGDVILAGHMSAVATASAIDKTEVIRSETTFADIIRGLHVYGRGILYPEALSVAYVVYA